MSGTSFCTCEMMSAKPVHRVVLNSSEVNFSGLDLNCSYFGFLFIANLFSDSCIQLQYLITVIFLFCRHFPPTNISVESIKNNNSGEAEVRSEMFELLMIIFQV